MKLEEAAATLASRFPKQARLINRVRKLGERARSVERHVILEPVSLQDLTEEKPKLFGLTPADYNAWRLHAAESSAVRMQDLEDGIASELVAERLTSSLILLRAHMEVAGLAAYAANRLWDAAEQPDGWQKLAPAIQKVYFGSSMFIQSRGIPDIRKVIGMGEVYPVGPTDYIKAMDRFAAPGKSPGKRFQATYGLLSESAHPAMRGSKPFSEVLAHRQFAWLIRYHAEETPNPKAVRMVFEILRDSMRIGCGASALLRIAEVGVHEDGALGLKRPTPRELARVFRSFIK